MNKTDIAILHAVAVLKQIETAVTGDMPPAPGRGPQPSEQQMLARARWAAMHADRVANAVQIYTATIIEDQLEQAVERLKDIEASFSNVFTVTIK